ncbi:hypothetical protein [Pseudomonas phage vB_PaeM_PS119XW]|uniref:Uncharacterized protein n=1 Tax=Pseudomonas phage vB_PaeM_PS119XW TaxID=2601632 RepID=A0A5C1K707_9CAUD|nr:hypothetical protein PP933_gp199 [Pseudomonas phage vB_PaeM_PS119XW]QEM41928.1 hypothetical protein [Pseudomonas phage vB_PaeM_PS119XW]
MNWKTLTAISIGVFIGATIVFGGDLFATNQNDETTVDEADATPINVE